MEKAAKQFKEAERFSDKYAKGLREANMVWSEYLPEMIMELRCD